MLRESDSCFSFDLAAIILHKEHQNQQAQVHQQEAQVHQQEAQLHQQEAQVHQQEAQVHQQELKVQQQRHVSCLASKSKPKEIALFQRKRFCLKYKNDLEEVSFKAWLGEMQKEAESLKIPRALWACYCNERIHAWIGSRGGLGLNSNEIDFLILHFDFVHTDSLESHPLKVRAVICANFANVDWKDSDFLQRSKNFMKGLLKASKRDEIIQQTRLGLVLKKVRRAKKAPVSYFPCLTAPFLSLSL